MKNRILFLLSLILIAFNGFGQVTFQRIITTQYGCAANAVIQTNNDGGYMVAGYTTDSHGNYQYVYMVKTNNYGDILWTKTFGEANGGLGYLIQQTTDNGYIVAGTTESADQGKDVYVVKTNAAGDSIWTRAYGGFVDDEGYCIQQTNDSGYIITGYTETLSRGADTYLLKTDSIGNATWSRTYGGSGYDVGNCVKQTSDSGYIICGYTESFGAGYENVYLIKTKPNGDTLWTKTYGGTNLDFANSVQQTKDGGYIIAGTTTSFGEGDGDVYLIKTNAIGDTLWTKTYGGIYSEQAADVQQTTDSGYIITGYTESFGSGGADVYLIKTNSIGDTLWTKSYGGGGYDKGASVRQTTDGGYIIAGSTGSFGSSNPYGGIYLIKTDANGNSGCNQKNTNTIEDSSATQTMRATTIVSSSGAARVTATILGSGGIDSSLCLILGFHDQTTNNTLSIYPNPANNELIIKNDNFRTDKSAIYIMNTLGQTVLQSSFVNLQSSINISSLTSGLYFVRLSNAEETWSGKFVKE